jgi:hypothetical protein
MKNSPDIRRLRLVALMLLLAALTVGVLIGSANRAAAGPPGPALPHPASQAAPQAQYRVLAWNDLGMHCYNPDFSTLAILPPYNTLWAQVVRVGDPPQLVTSGITVTYVFTRNTYSAGKTNFWQYAQQLFGVSLPPNVGLKGKGLSGTLDLAGDHFQATGIPLTEYTDDNPAVPAPYQLATITVLDGATGVTLTQSTVVAPVSTELSCADCHSQDGDASTTYPISPTASVDVNILKIHDYLSQGQYPAGHEGSLLTPGRGPILCAECHPSNALGAAGLPGVKSLSNAIHGHHNSPDIPDITPDTEGCYKCHPGPATQCLRDTMSQTYGMNCLNCHGDLLKVSQNPNPWGNEPRCDDAGCHGSGYKLTQPLYRNSIGHGHIYCEGCHDSTHAIAPSREANDGLKFISLQGHPGTLRECTTCHLTQPAGFTHAATWSFYLPLLTQRGAGLR